VREDKDPKICLSPEPFYTRSRLFFQTGA